MWGEWGGMRHHAVGEVAECLAGLPRVAPEHQKRLERRLQVRLLHLVLPRPGRPPVLVRRAPEPHLVQVRALRRRTGRSGGRGEHTAVSSSKMSGKRAGAPPPRRARTDNGEQARDSKHARDPERTPRPPPQPPRGFPPRTSPRGGRRAPCAWPTKASSAM